MPPRANRSHSGDRFLTGKIGQVDTIAHHHHPCESFSDIPGRWLIFLRIFLQVEDPLSPSLPRVPEHTAFGLKRRRENESKSSFVGHRFLRRTPARRPIGSRLLLFAYPPYIIPRCYVTNPRRITLHVTVDSAPRGTHKPQIRPLLFALLDLSDFPYAPCSC